jgi:hypothetical protein
MIPPEEMHSSILILPNNNSYGVSYQSAGARELWLP